MTMNSLFETTSSQNIFVMVLLVATFLLMGLSYYPATRTPALFLMETDDDSTCTLSCWDNIIMANCYDTSTPVLGGLDVVDYFSFPNDTIVGSAGVSDYTVTFRNYTFYFKSEANRDIFMTSPAQYAPAWGGFCSYGISAEL